MALDYGLPIVKQLMEQHNDGAEFNSEEDKGTCFVLWPPQHQKIKKDHGIKDNTSSVWHS